MPPWCHSLSHFNFHELISTLISPYEVTFETPINVVVVAWSLFTSFGRLFIKTEIEPVNYLSQRFQSSRQNHVRVTTGSGTSSAGGADPDESPDVSVVWHATSWVVSAPLDSVSTSGVHLKRQPLTKTRTPQFSFFLRKPLFSYELHHLLFVSRFFPNLLLIFHQKGLPFYGFS